MQRSASITTSERVWRSARGSAAAIASSHARSMRNPSLCGSGPTIIGMSMRTDRSGVCVSPSPVRNSTAGCLRTMSQAVENSSRKPSLAGCVMAACEKYERQKP